MAFLTFFRACLVLQVIPPFFRERTDWDPCALPAAPTVTTIPSDYVFFMMVLLRTFSASHALEVPWSFGAGFGGAFIGVPSSGNFIGLRSSNIPLYPGSAVGLL
jgi:hypothetical protein